MTARFPIRGRLSPFAFAALAAVALFVTLEPAARAAPEPEPVPVRWEFDFREGPLRLATVEVPGVGPRKYFYFTYRVANFSGQDRMLAPSFDLVTDEGEVLRGGRGVPGFVTQELLARLQNPLLLDQLRIVSTLNQGLEHSRFGLVIWPATDLDIDEVTLFATGFSGENTPYFTTDPETGERIRHLLRKTRMIRYGLPGRLENRGALPFEVDEARWVMR
ncbi:MAG: hypothetical protein AAF297_03325 [Planctomycetota bacterium]